MFLFVLAYQIDYLFNLTQVIVFNTVKNLAKVV